MPSPPAPPDSVPRSRAPPRPLPAAAAAAGPSTPLHAAKCEKNGASNSSIASRKPPSRVYILPGVSGAAIVVTFDIPTLRRNADPRRRRPLSSSRQKEAASVGSAREIAAPSPVIAIGSMGGALIASRRARSAAQLVQSALGGRKILRIDFRQTNSPIPALSSSASSCSASSSDNRRDSVEQCVARRGRFRGRRSLQLPSDKSPSAPSVG